MYFKYHIFTNIYEFLWYLQRAFGTCWYYCGTPLFLPNVQVSPGLWRSKAFICPKHSVSTGKLKTVHDPHVLQNCNLYTCIIVRSTTGRLENHDFIFWYLWTTGIWNYNRSLGLGILYSHDLILNHRIAELSK